MNAPTSKQIRIACKGSRLELLSNLEIIQGDLKQLSEENLAKLRKRIETKGFDAPFFVWKNKILDGTQRKKVLDAMLADGWTLRGGKVPVCDIQAKNLQDAKDRLLGYVSQYGKVTFEGLKDYLDGIEMPDIETIDLPDFDMGNIDPEHFGDIGGTGMPNLNSGDRQPFQQMTFTLHDSQVEIVKQAIAQAKEAGSFDESPNENSNGNALARIAEAYSG